MLSFGVRSRQSARRARVEWVIFSERDLLDHAVASGFRSVALDLVVECRPGSWVVDWERLLDVAPNPNTRTTR
jgi:hypothetical protein